MRVLFLNGSLDTPTRTALPRELSTRRIRVESAGTVTEGLALAGQKRFAAILIAHPDQPAELIKRLRADFGTPIVVLREVKDPDEAIECLESGADEVLAEPLDVDELVARLRSLNRRCHPGDRELLSVDDLELAPKEQTACRGGSLIHLSDREFEVLEYMMLHHDRVLSHNELADQISSAEPDPYSNEIDATIATLRAKIHTPGKKRLIHSVLGRGYMLSEMPPLTPGV
jgi:two-component system OmpR family response regulator